MGHKIFNLMAEKNITKEDLVKTIDCPNTVNILELKWGYIYPSFDQLQSISNLLGVDINDLLDAEDAYPDWQNSILDIIDSYVDVFNAANEIN